MRPLFGPLLVCVLSKLLPIAANALLLFKFKHVPLLASGQVTPGAVYGFQKQLAEIGKSVGRTANWWKTKHTARMEPLLYVL